jgi:membrane-associated protein
MLDHILALSSSPWVYLIVFVLVAVDGFLPVVPSETVVIGLGALSSNGSPNVVALATAAIAGGMAGDRLSYALGGRAGGRLTNSKLARAKDKAERALGRYGGGAILVGRFLPYGRTATTLTSGSMAMPLGRFRLFTALAGAAWAAYVIGLGRLGGAVFAGSPLLGTLAGLAFGMTLGAVYAFVEKRRGSAAEDPRLGPAGDGVRLLHDHEVLPAVTVPVGDRQVMAVVGGPLRGDHPGQ